ncbi:MAG: helix-turn-helix-domain containing protein AraC type [Sphingobacteriales bacterium]|nr:helix-turn-helix-domain containing protein AraC type [Sphingobacteriales bacterium]
MANQNPDFSFYLSVFCCLHLWLLCLFLISKKKRSTSDYLIALFLFSFSFIHLQHLLLQAGYLNYVPFFDPVMGIILSSSGPIFYFYVRSMTGEDNLWPKMKIHLWVLIPAIVHFLFLLFTKNGAELQDYYYKTSNQATQYTLINLLLLVGTLGYFLFYLIASIRALNRHSSNIKQSYSNIEKLQLNWLRDLIIVLMIFACIIAPISIYIANTQVSQLAIGYFSTFIYFIIVYKSLNYSVVFSSTAIPVSESKWANAKGLNINLIPIGNLQHPFPENVNTETIAISAQETALVTTERYTKSALSNEQVEEFGHSVEIFLISNSLLFDQDLSLKQMSDALNLSTHILSEVINRYYNKSFFELINSFRIEEAKKQLKQINQSNYTIEGIGYNCGFGSRAAFYRAFKKYTKMTPTEFNAHQSSNS